MHIKILNLKAKRELAGMNASELAKKVGISPAAMHYIETGANSPTLDTACAIADALGITLDELLDRDSLSQREGV